MRWLQFGCFTPLMQAHGRFQQEAWTYDRETLKLYRELRAAARAARAVRARRGRHGRALRPADHPPARADRPGRRARLARSPTPTGTARRCGWRRCSRTARASARCALPRGRPGSTSGPASAVEGGGAVAAAAPLERIPVWVRDGSLDRHLPGRSTSRRAWATRRSSGGRSRRRCGASRRAAAPARIWRTARACAGVAASGR